jgi:hypothetical protein
MFIERQWQDQTMLFSLLLVFTANFSDAKQTDRVRTGKTTCKSVEPVENLQNCKKSSTPVRGEKPNGKSRIQYVLMG